MPHLEVRKVVKRYGSRPVLDQLSLTVEQGEFVSLLGPSGCGKTTLLRAIAGLGGIDSGELLLGGRSLAGIPAHRRDVSVVFQNYALFPHLNVADNVGFGLRARGVPAAEAAARVRDCLALVQMEAFAGRRIQALSGGQQQRVAIARAVAVRPLLMLLDEPLSALDRKLRETMQIELRRLFRELGMTAIFVTHDQDEAMALSDRVAVMREGAIEQIGEPSAIYGRPATPYVLDFVGQSNTIAGTVRSGGGGELLVDTALGALRAPGSFRPGAPVLLAVRPERVQVSESWAPAPGANSCRAVLRDRIYKGSRALLEFAVPDAQRSLLAELDPLAGGALAPGSAATLSWSLADTLVFPKP